MCKNVSFWVLKPLEGKTEEMRKQANMNLKRLNKFNFFTKKVVFISKSPFSFDISGVT